jgi:hypothetical protein
MADFESAQVAPRTDSSSLSGRNMLGALAAARKAARDEELDASESGICDLDGLLEQLGTQDWQQGAMA